MPGMVVSRRILMNAKGVSLLEVLIALALVALALLSLSTISTVAIKGTARARQLTVGTVLAQEKMESMKMAGYDPMLIGRQEVVEFYGTMLNFPRYQRVALRVSHTPRVGMQTVTVKVSWNHDAHSVTLATILGP